MSKKEKSEAEKLREELFLSRKNGCLVLEEEEIKEIPEQGENRTRGCGIRNQSGEKRRLYRV